MAALHENQPAFQRFASKPLPNKPLPTKPLPSRSPSPQPPASPQPSPSPQPSTTHQPSQPKQAACQVADVPPIPHPQPPPQAQPKLQTQTHDPFPAPANNGTPDPASDEEDWYKPSLVKKNSYRPAKKCTLILDDKRAKQKKIKLFQTYDKFFIAEGNEQNFGFQVQSICDNEFGAEFTKIGIGCGWRVTKIGNTALKTLRFPMLKNQILAAGQKADGKGYYLLFDGNPPPKSKQTEDDSKMNDISGVPKLTAAPVSMGKKSVELLSSYNDHKVVVLKHSIEKYAEFESVAGPKGYKISAFKKQFGDDLKQYGVDLGWRVTKLGDKDVSNLFTQMIRTNLEAEWRNNKANGIKITFGMPLS